jgi:hypothetical protein
MKKIMLIASFMLLLFTTACSSSGMGDGHESMTEVKNLKVYDSPLYPVGTDIILNTDHMEGMMDAKGSVSGAYNTTLYAVDYTSEETGEEVKDHKWIIKEEIKDSKDKDYSVGDSVTLMTGHMSSMGGEGVTATITQIVLGPAYMVDYTPTNGDKEVKDHQWVSESEIKSTN